MHYRPNTGDNGGGRQRGRHRRPRAGLARVPCGPCPVLRAAAHDLPQPDPDRGDRAAQGPVTPGESVVVRARIVPGEIILFGVRVVLAILHRKGIPLGTTGVRPLPGMTPDHLMAPIRILCEGLIDISDECLANAGWGAD